MTYKPTDGELDILKILWEKGKPLTVREVHEILELYKPGVYTTTLKIMQIMNEKGLLKREESGKAHLYEAAITEADTQQQFLDKLIDGVFGGSVGNMILQALGNRKSSQEELDQIKAYLDKLESDEEK